MSVSNYFRHRARLTAATAERIHDAVVALDYRPNRAAGALRHAPARALGFIADLGDATNLEVLAGSEQAAQERGWLVQIGDSWGSSERERTLVELLSAGAVGGVLVRGPSRSTPGSGREVGRRATSVLIARLRDEAGGPVVVII